MTTHDDQPVIGLVSLGCPKALVDSEGIVTQLRAEGYQFSPDYDGADAVIINTCGFLDSAKEESLATIAEAMEENGKVIVTGCLGVEADMIRERFPEIQAVTGPQARDDVVKAVHDVLPKPHDPFMDLVPDHGVKLTPRHYSYIKISEGCSNACRFCIIPDIRGKLVSRPIASVLHEAERLVKGGSKELLIISQDTSAYGQDIKYQPFPYHGRDIPTKFYHLVEELAQMEAWVRLHYVYPYPHVNEVIPMMNETAIVPYLDIPFQHAAPDVLKSMRRPAHSEKVLDRIQNWRKICPDLAIRSTFIVGYPGETEADFNILLDWLEEAQIDRIGCFQYEPVAGARANDLNSESVPDDIKKERWQRLMEKAQAISAERLAQKVGREIEVVVDSINPEEDMTLCRSQWDAPEIDGQVIIEDESDYEPGDRVKVTITDADEYDLYAEPVRFR